MGITIQAIDNSDGNLTVYDTDGITPLTAPNVDAVNINTQQYYPRKTEHNLMNGGLVTFTPNVKTRLTLELQFLSRDDYKYIVQSISYRYKIQSESDDNLHPLIGEKIYLYSGEALDFNYSNQFKGAGFSGSLTFIET